MRITPLPWINEMPTHYEMRNLTQCITQLAKATSVTALAGITHYQALHVPTTAHEQPGFRASLWPEALHSRQLLDSSDIFSKVCIVLWLRSFPQTLTVLRSFIFLCNDEQDNSQHCSDLVIILLSWPTASRSCKAECSWSCLAISCLRLLGYVEGVLEADVRQLSSIPPMLIAPSPQCIILRKWAEISGAGGFNPPSKSNHPFKKKQGAIQPAKPN